MKTGNEDNGKCDGVGLGVGPREGLELGEGYRYILSGFSQIEYSLVHLVFCNSQAN